MRIYYRYSTKMGMELGKWLKGLDCELIVWTGSNKYDLGVSFLNTMRIPWDELQKSRWINFHPGPLPEMRGRDLAYHAIMEGRKEFGATLHYMDEGFDTGPIVEARRFPILDWHTAGDLVEISHNLLQEMFLDYLPRFVAGEKIAGKPQEKSEGKYYRKGKIEEMVELTKGQERKVRALTVEGRYYARMEIGGVGYCLAPEEEL